MTPVEETEAKLRAAIDQGQYPEAQRLAADYFEGLEEELARLPEGDERAAGLFSSTLELLEWARRRVRAGREHTRLELGRLGADRPYRPPGRRRRPIWAVEG